MDHHTVKRLWEPEQELPQLRRPVLAQPNDSKPAAANALSTTEVAKNSTLSVEAKEWYPPGYNESNFNRYTPQTHNITTSSVQSRLNKYKHHDNDNKFKDKLDYDKQLEYLYEIINLLTVKPGKFDHVLKSLIDFLAPYINDIQVMSKATAAIFQQALVESNFQYSGARLFAELDKHCPFVRACLHSLCENELEKTGNMQNLTLFYAEIYSQLNFELFGKCLLQALKRMAPVPDNAKYICQTLKLTGAKLETLDKALIEDILKQLEKIRPVLPSSMSNLVQSVINLRNSQWGQAEIHANALPIEQDEWSDGPVFYGPDGNELTLEESEFLTESLNDFILDDSDPDALWNPEPEMSLEIREAFAEFVQSNKR